jgi:hypothetical protein
MGCGKFNKSGDVTGRTIMFAIFIILLLMWFFGMISNYTFGGAVHLLLVFAVIALIIRLVQGRRVV